jgi:hypothetical protein
LKLLLSNRSIAFIAIVVVWNVAFAIVLDGYR